MQICFLLNKISPHPLSLLRISLRSISPAGRGLRGGGIDKILSLKYDFASHDGVFHFGFGDFFWVYIENILR